jgi:hypothetical protein
VGMFVPIGIFFVLLFGRRMWFASIIGGVLLTLGIEFAQPGSSGPRLRRARPRGQQPQRGRGCAGAALVLTGREHTAAANPTRLIRRAQPLERFSAGRRSHPVAASTGRRRQQAAGVNSRTAHSTAPSSPDASSWVRTGAAGRVVEVARIGLSHAMVGPAATGAGWHEAGQ